MAEQGKADSFVSVMGWVTGLRLIGLPLQFLVFVLVARLYPLSDVGVYAVANAMWQAFKGLGPIGLDVAAMRFGPALLAEGQIRALQSLEQTSQRVVLLVTTAVAFLVAGASVVVPRWQSTSGPGAVLLLSAGIPLFSLLGLQVGQLRSRNLIKAAQFPESILLHVLSGISIATGWLLGARSVSWALAATVVSVLVVVVVNHLSLNRLHTSETQPLEHHLRRQVAHAATHMFAGQALATVGARISPLVITALAGPSATGLFEAAARLGQFASVSTWAAGIAASPQIAAAHARGDRTRLQFLVTISSWAAFLPAAGAALLVAAFGKSLLLMFGGVYTAAYPAAVLLGAATAVNAAGGLSATTLYMTGKEKSVVRLTLLSVFGLLVALGVAVPRIGIIGAGVALLLAACIRDGGASVILRPTLNLAPGVFSGTGCTQFMQLVAGWLRMAMRRTP